MIYAPMAAPRKNRRRRARPVAPTFTEAQIKAALDGHFFHVGGLTEKVPTSFMPLHVNRFQEAARPHLSEQRAKAILQYVREGASIKEAAQHFAVHPETVRYIVTGRTWKHLTAPESVKPRINRLTQWARLRGAST